MLADKIRQWANLITAFGQLAVSVTASANIGAISDSYPNYIVPADYAFSIWGLIFLLSAAYSIYQFLPARREDALLREIGWLSALTFLSNSLWMTVFPQNLIVLSTAIIVVMLISLVWIVTKIHEHYDGLKTWETWLVYATFSIFAGWITVATVVNATIALVASNVTDAGLSGIAWGVIILVVTGFLAAAVTYKLRGNLPYGVTVIWALTGTFLNQALSWTSASAATTAVVAATMIVLMVATLIFVRL